MRQNAAPPPRGILHSADVPSDDVGGTIEHARVLPPVELSHVVAHFWSVTWRLRADKRVATLPHPTMHLVFECSGGDNERAELVGVPKARFERTLDGDGWVFGVKLRPATLGALVCDANAAALTGRVVPLERVCGARASEWSRAIFAAPSVDARVCAMVPLLASALRPLSEDAARLRDVVERIATDATITRVEQVAALVHQTPRTLQRRFLAAVGVSPKWVIRRYRLHEAAERLRAAALASGLASPPALATLAAELGYADQAHFGRDFVAAVGQTPTQFVRMLVGAQRRAPTDE